MSSDSLVPYWKSVITSARNVEKSFDNRDVKLYMAGMRAGADLLLAMAELNNGSVCSDTFVYAEYLRDKEKLDV